MPQRQGRRRRSRATKNIPVRRSRRSTTTPSRSRSASRTATFLRRIAGAVYYILPQHILERPDGRAGRDLRRSASASPARRSAPARTTSPSRSRPPARRSRPRRTTGRARTRPIETIVYKIQESNVSVAQLAAGELDLTIRVPPAEGPGLANVARPASSSTCRASASSPSTSTTRNTDKALRQAIAYAINRPEIIEKVLGGLATLNYTIPPGFKVYDDINKYDFDPDKAKELLATSKWDVEQAVPARATSPRIRTSPSRLRRSSSTSQDIGMKVELTALPTAPYIGRDPEDQRLGGLPVASAAARAWAGISPQQYYTCPGLGHAPAEAQRPEECSLRPARSRRPQASPATRRTRSCTSWPSTLNDEPARDLPLAAQLPARVHAIVSVAASPSTRTSASRSRRSSTGPTRRSPSDHRVGIRTSDAGAHRPPPVQGNRRSAAWAPTSFARILISIPVLLGITIIGFVALKRRPATRSWRRSTRRSWRTSPPIPRSSRRSAIAWASISRSSPTST